MLSAAPTGGGGGGTVVITVPAVPPPPEVEEPTPSLVPPEAFTYTTLPVGESTQAIRESAPDTETQRDTVVGRIRAAVRSGAEPASTEAYEWQYEPVTRTFVNKPQQRWLYIDDYLAQYWPALRLARNRCRHGEVTAAELLPGRRAADVGATRSNPADEVAIALIRTDADGAPVSAREQDGGVVVALNARRDDLTEVLARWLQRAPDDFQLEVVHPRMYDYEQRRPLAGAAIIGLTGETRVGDTLLDFTGLGPTPQDWVVPVLVRPSRRHEARLASTPGLIATGRTRRERLDSLARQVRARRTQLESLRVHAATGAPPAEAPPPEVATTTPAERACSHGHAAVREEARRSGVEAPDRATCESLRSREAAASRLLADVLDSLEANFARRHPLSPDDEHYLVDWLVGAVLFGRELEGIDYPALYRRLQQRIVEGQDPARRSWLPFLVWLDEAVDAAIDVEAQKSHTRTRRPIFDPRTGEVVDYEETLNPEYVQSAPLAVVSDDEPVQDAATEDFVEGMRWIECTQPGCNKWRALEPGFDHVEYVAYEREPRAGVGELRHECLRFGLVFLHDRTNVEERVPLNADYVVSEGYVPVAIRGTPLVAAQGAAFFGTAAPVSSEEGEATTEYDVELFYPDLAPAQRLLTLPARTTTLYGIDQNAPAEPDGRVRVHLREAPRTTVEHVRGGRAVRFYCELANGEVLDLPLTQLVRVVERAWVCGDPGMGAPTPVVQETLRRLRSLERLRASRLLPAENDVFVGDQIEFLRQQLHLVPTETAQDATRRLGRRFRTELDQDWIDAQAAEDEAAEEGLRAGSNRFVAAQAQEATGERELAALARYEQVREDVRKRRLDEPEEVDAALAQMQAAVQERPRAVPRYAESMPPGPMPEDHHRAALRSDAATTTTLYRRIEALLEREFPTGAHYEEVAARLWVEDGQSEHEPARYRADLDFRRPRPENHYARWVKQVHAAMNKSRKTPSPILLLETAPRGRGRGAGRYLHDRHLRPDTVDAILQASTRDALQRSSAGGLRFDPRHLRKTLADRMRAPSSAGAPRDDDDLRTIMDMQWRAAARRYGMDDSIPSPFADAEDVDATLAAVERRGLDPREVLPPLVADSVDAYARAYQALTVGTDGARPCPRRLYAAVRENLLDGAPPSHLFQTYLRGTERCSE